MEPNERTRRIAPPILAGVAAVAVLAGLLAGYAWRTVFDSDQFAKRAAVALDDPAVRDEAARRVAGRLVSAKPDLIAIQPVIEGVVSGIVGGRAFQGLFRAGIADLHRAVFTGDQDTLTLTLADIGATVRGALEALEPDLGRKIPPTADVDLVDTAPAEALASAIRLADKAWVPIALLVVGVFAGVGSIRLATDPRRAGRTVGVAIALAAVITIVAIWMMEAVLLSSVESQGARDAVAGIWSAFLDDLLTALALLAMCGAVLAAAASSLLAPVDIQVRLERAWALAVRVPERRGWRAVRALLLLALGLLIVLRSGDFLTLVAILLGLGVVYAGVSELMWLTVADRSDVAAERRRGRATLIAAGVTAAAILGAAAIFIGVGGISERSPAIETEGCNGSQALCDRPLDRIAFAATHNSMSAASDPGWLFAAQERGVSDQLRDGIRGLFIDAHGGVETRDGTIKTDLSDLSRGERAAYEEALGAEAVDAALRIRDRIVSSPEVGSPGIYLCHRFCEVGATPIERAFGDLRDFLAADADEVVVVVIEDYVEPSEIAAAAERTGLIDYVYTGPVGPPWPTLQQMIDSGGRVVMLAENRRDEAVPWYHPAYDRLLQETPFKFARPSQLLDASRLTASCEPNRGPAAASLFLINHWIDTSPAPRPSNAAKVNSREALLRRIRHCQDQRGLLASLISVDFYREGDVFAAVDELNSGRASDPR